MASQGELKTFCPDDAVAGKETQGLTGKYTARQAVAKLLADSGLSYTFMADNAVAIKVAQADPPPEGGSEAAKPEPGEEVVTLPEITVIGQPWEAAPHYQTDESTAATRLPLEITRVPQSIQVITGDAIRDQGALSISDLVKHVPSATLNGSRYTRFPSVRIRGFTADELRNGISKCSLPIRIFPP